MTVLGDASSYLLCDLDPGSTADLRRWASRLGLHDCQVLQADGMAAVAAWLDGDAGQAAGWCTWIRSIPMLEALVDIRRSSSPDASPTAALHWSTGMATASPASKHVPTPG